MLDVFITVDTEVWCGGWSDLDQRFPEMFGKYIYGHTKHGSYGLPGKLDILEEHGLQASFFVETLFSARFGKAPLDEIIGLILEKKQEVQLHLHPEWIDEANDPDFPALNKKVSELAELSEEHQCALLNWGVNALIHSGADKPSAFRSGSYSANMSTLRALSRAGITIDTSYNPGCSLGTSDISLGTQLRQPSRIGDVFVYPVTVFDDGVATTPRHLQLSACSFSEFKHVLMQAVEKQWDSVVIVSHNFELMNPVKTSRDYIMVRRFRQLCHFLQKNSDLFNVRGFQGLKPDHTNHQPDQLRSSALRTGGRYVEQALRKLA